MTKRTLFPIALLFAVLAVLLVAAVIVLGPGAGRPPAGEEPPLAGATIGGPFSLIDQNGKPFTSQNLSGRYALIYFGYTFCPDVCPTDVQRMMQGLKQFEKKDPARGAKVQPVFITVDPERDTPEAVKQFVSAFHPRLIGLTGSPAAVEQAMKAYRIYAKKAGPEGSKDYLVDHSANGYLFDTEGRPMLLFASTDTPEAIAAQLNQWVK